MSNSTTELLRKINGAQNLQSVVSTMKAISATSIGQYEKSVHALATYYATIEQGLGACLRLIPFSLGQEQTKKAESLRGAVIFGSDMGLVGQFNDAIVDYALQTLKPFPHTAFWAVGEHVYGRLMQAGQQPRGRISVPNSISAITSLVGQILMQTELHQGHNKFSEFYLFCNRPALGISYQPVGQKLLPLDESWRANLTKYPWPTKNLPEIMNSTSETLRALIREYLFVSLYRASAESLASEHASRLASMQRADKNITELLAELNQKYHHLRQSSIDEELFDVISSFEALPQKGT